ncbi:hypothetical protein RRG08_049843 [Elysia crispata]|uniref:Transposase n=1 Tax=Elysia crispata TaxID=231223 RepID=A0AAE1DM47_9GAST|nr:hypothetical protein RRG08_049843 [Elysia crispata]
MKFCAQTFILRTITNRKKTTNCGKFGLGSKAWKKNLAAISPGEHQYIDEVMIAFKGKSKVKQFMRNKPEAQTVGQNRQRRSHDFEVYRVLRKRKIVQDWRFLEM